MKTRTLNNGMLTVAKDNGGFLCYGNRTAAQKKADKVNAENGRTDARAWQNLQGAGFYVVLDWNPAPAEHFAATAEAAGEGDAAALAELPAATAAVLAEVASDEPVAATEPVTFGIPPAPPDEPRPAFLLVDLSADDEVGVYDTHREAQAAARKLPRYCIYSGLWDGEEFTHGQRVENCDPYDGDDARAAQGLGCDDSNGDYVPPAPKRIPWEGHVDAEFIRAQGGVPAADVAVMIARAERFTGSHGRVMTAGHFELLAASMSSAPPSSPGLSPKGLLRRARRYVATLPRLQGGANDHFRALKAQYRGVNA